MIGAVVHGTAGHIMSQVILGVSGLVVGLALYLGVVNTIDAVRTKRAGYVGYALIRLGTAIVVGLVMEAVFGQDIPVTWKSVAYALGLTMLVLGSLIVLLTGTYRQH